MRGVKCGKNIDGLLMDINVRRWKECGHLENVLD